LGQRGKMALPAGLSPAAWRFEAARSNTLSYGSVRYRFLCLILDVQPDRMKEIQGSESEGRSCPGLRRAFWGTSSLFFNQTSYSLEIGGPPRTCTVLCPGKSRSFTIKVCSPYANAKAELNRPSQACEVLTVTGISRRVKWSERQVTLPLPLAPEASASLLGYALRHSPAH
jgi:hypothetical protein